MKVIVAGSRSFCPDDNEDYRRKMYFWVMDTLYFHFFGVPDDVEIVSGLAKGPDLWGKEWAEERLWPVKEFPADWATHGKVAGAIRNEQMGNYADALIAFWDGKSQGTKHMIDYMLSIGKEVHVYQSPR